MFLSSLIISQYPQKNLNSTNLLEWKKKIKKREGGWGYKFLFIFIFYFLILEILQCSYYVKYMLVMLSSYYTKMGFFTP